MRILLMLMGVSLGLGGCGSGGSGGNPSSAGAVAAVVVTPTELALNIGDSRQLQATMRDSEGRALQGKAVTWSSGDSSKVVVTADGVVSALSAGTTTVMASVEGRSATSRIAIQAPHATVDRVVLDVVSEIIEEGDSLQLTATAFDAGHNVITGRGVRWSSSDPGTVGVEVDGRVTALRPGVVSVTATIDGESAAATIRVFANQAFDLLYAVADVAAPEELYSLDLNDPAAVAMPLFPQGRPASHGAPSPDGARVAFVVYGSAWPSTIFVADRNGGNAQRLTSGSARNTAPTWSPDGRQIAFSSQMLGATADVWVVNVDGSNAVNVTADQPNSNKRTPTWSPQLGGGGSRIAYSLEADGSSHLWTMGADGSDKRPVTSNPEHFDSEPAWSPDGSTLVFQRTGVATFGDLYLVSSTGGVGRPLMPGNALAYGQFGPAWSPDGRLIAFASKHSDGERYQIWTVWSDGTRLARRTGALTSHSDPAWIKKP